MTAPPRKQTRVKHLSLVMSSPAQTRIAGLFMSLLLAVGVPLLVFGPVLFNGVPVADIPFAEKTCAAVSILFGWWLAIVAYAAAAEDVEEVLKLFQAGNEMVLLFLPVMLWAGTKSVLRRCGYGRGNRRTL